MWNGLIDTGDPGSEMLHASIVRRVILNGGQLDRESCHGQAFPVRAVVMPYPSGQETELGTAVRQYSTGRPRVLARAYMESKMAGMSQGASGASSRNSR
jgi:hypothetical protein